MNALLGYERAIVTEEKGTTRDTLSESYVYKGVNFIVTDTAGLREAESLPEKMGISRAYARWTSATRRFSSRKRVLRMRK